ncbi:D-lactate dehydrogenase (cytochrome) [Maritimibacter alkaliphilus HTCC2654]|uniref:D-lactate dehydrogenase (cytochrome) n=1 Tax=Maritimibacter alkaliphilus HTCC2654 TaxID=314271 RepID=A3VI11_9RHOB|nr:FAD-linked oxidase C-terminal domain-containing protein [Maritimibacter alkaliphilus]EAQ12010.1 putative D-lactate dehydrogenase (cytochrome), FAD/FMN-containing oxidoreductase [Rhodobacterales bacterium HTCC2654] [Maritimibacter alkaliphilus HTCC2654]TYP83063.1 D-lactate dehydrogenase (cytochrome) [Maritimibacter alkaliphilus HTCC2654]
MAFDAAFSELATVLGDRLSRSKSDLDAHGGSETHFALAPPDAVAYPQSTEDVSRILAICHAHGVPVIAYGAGTSLEGHTSAIRGGVTLDFSRMADILTINQGDMDVVVQPGLTREDLNRELRATGLFFSVDPGANASVGGMAATRASGTTTVRYGTMRDNVLALQVVLADGRVIRTGTRARKSSSGYDLTGLFLGSEGTLGIITELTLRLNGQPEAISAGICAFDRMSDAVEAVVAVIQMGLPMARIEFLDADAVRAVNAYSGSEVRETPHLFVEFHGSQASVAEDAERFGEIVADFGASGVEVATKPEDRSALWTMRHHAYWACLGLKPGATAVVTDVCVPISHLAQAVEETQADIAASIIDGPILGHVGDGNFHAILLVDPAQPAELEAAKSLAARMNERALRLGGTVTGEHGIGMGKLAYMEAQHGDAWDVMTDIKTALDPKGILNPGKVVRG